MIHKIIFNKMNNKKILAIIIILALILRIIFALIVPIFEKPDENAHFEYIQFVAENKKLPVQTKDDIHAEFFQPPFYHYFSSFILRFIKTFTQDLSYQVISMRLVSIFISIVTLLTIYKMASLIFKNSNLVLGIVAFAAFLPSHININSSVTNENFADFLTTLIIYLLLLFIVKSENYKNIILLGIITGISLITRLSIIPVIATIPFAFTVKYYPNIKKAVKPVVLIAIIALLISSWLFARNLNLYGDILGINAMKLASPPEEIKVNLAFAARLAGWTFITFWASFGRTNDIFIGNLTSQSGIATFFLSYSLLLLFSIGAVFGLYIFFKNYRKNKNILSNNQKKSFIIVLFHLALLSLIFLSFNFYDFQPQGRLFFSAISTISIFFTFGIYNLLSLYNKIRLFLPVCLILFILMDIASIISVVRHY